jgi:hypothetical protein
MIILSLFVLNINSKINNKIDNQVNEFQNFITQMFEKIELNDEDLISLFNNETSFKLNEDKIKNYSTYKNFAFEESCQIENKKIFNKSHKFNWFFQNIVYIVNKNNFSVINNNQEKLFALNQLIEFYSRKTLNKICDFILNSIKNNKQINYEKLKEFINMNFNNILYKIELTDENYRFIFFNQNNDSHKELYNEMIDFEKQINESFTIEKLEEFCLAKNNFKN